MRRRGVAVAGGLTCALVLAAGCSPGAPATEVPEGWSQQNVGGLGFAYPPDYATSADAEALYPNADVVVNGPFVDGVSPVLAVTQVAADATSDVALRTDVLLARLDVNQDGLEVAEERELDVPGAAEALFLDYTFGEGEFPSRAFQVVIAAEDGRGWGVRYGLDEDLFDADIAQQIIDSLAVGPAA